MYIRLVRHASQPFLQLFGVPTHAGEKGLQAEGLKGTGREKGRARADAPAFDATIEALLLLGHQRLEAISGVPKVRRLGLCECKVC